MSRVLIVVIFFQQHTIDRKSSKWSSCTARYFSSFDIQCIVEYHYSTFEK